MSDRFIELRAPKKKTSDDAEWILRAKVTDEDWVRIAYDESTIYLVRLRITALETMEFQVIRGSTTLSSSQQLRN
ncbi:hypothetical protein PspS35_10145 [Pseudomonas sp. S35]|jgi:hypothetical protein|nr:hypothetical protein PspS35_10145 [Pseudomonas sp. S35]